MTKKEQLKEALRNPKQKIQLTFKQTQKLKKGKPVKVVINYEAYEIVPCELPRELLKYSQEQLRTALRAKG